MKAIKRGRTVAFLAGVILLAAIGMGHALGTADTDVGKKLLQYTAGGHVLGFDAGKMYAASGSHMLRVEFVGAAKSAPVAEGGGMDEKGKAQPLTRVEYPELWRNVSLVYESKAGAVLKSTYYVAPGGRPEDIRLKYNGPVQVASDGGIEIGLQAGSFTEAAPVAWQEKDGRRVNVPVRFKNVSNTEAGFVVGAYDKTLPLVIDPALLWNTFLGGNLVDMGTALALDGSGNVYVAGISSESWGSPVREFTYRIENSQDVFVAKLADNGTLVWNTFLGSEPFDYGYGIAVDGSGHVYVAGYSDATWGSPLEEYKGGGDAFVAKLADNGTLIWNTFLGSSGSDYGYGVAVDGSGKVYVAGQSYLTWGSPVRALSGTNVFAAKLADNGTLIWNTFLGSALGDTGSEIAVGGSGKVYVAGQSNGTWESPVRAFAGSKDVFVAKLADNGTLIWNTFLGCSSYPDYVKSLAVDGSGKAYVAGYSQSTWGSPVRAFSVPLGYEEAFVAKLADNGTLIWNTFLGAAWMSEYGYAIAVDDSSNVYVGGYGPYTWGAPVEKYHGGTSDAFVAKLADNGTLKWNTFLGGNGNDSCSALAVDGSGNVYVAGATNGDTWGSPVRAYSSDAYDCFVAKLIPSPEMKVTGNSVEILDNDTTPSPADYTDFGSAEVTSSTVVRTFSIGNIGDRALDLTGDPKVSISGPHAGDFNLTAEPDATVTSGSGTTFQVTFAPSAFGERTAQISIINNDIDENPYNFAIKGTGLCNFVLSSSSASFTAEAGTGSFEMTTTSGCAWSAVDNATWITITSDDNSTGSTTVDYSVAANPGIARSGAITIGDQKFTVSQASGCTVSINPESAWHNGLAGSYEIDITASDSSCPWGAHSNDPSWITITSDNGTGNGTVYYNIAEYFIASGGSTTRTGTISAAGQMFTVTQTAHFADDGGGTVSDNITGLEWFKDARIGAAADWEAALDAVDALNNANGGSGTYNHKDWRLPTADEFRRFIDKSRTNPALPAGHPFTNVQFDEYWSSTTRESSTNNSAYVVNLGTGDNASYRDKNTTELFYWPVRSGDGSSYKTLKVNKTGRGTGQVLSAAINQKIEVLCDPVCFTAFDNGTTVTLTATPDDSMSISGRSAWTGCDSFTTDNACIVDMDEPCEVEVRFDNPYNITVNPKAIIVAGSGPYDENNLWDVTEAMTSYAYIELLKQGFTDASIYYMTFDPTADADNDGSSDYDNESSNEHLEHAITGWALDADSLVIYLIGHGIDGQFEINGVSGEFLTGEDLGQWLDILQGAAGMPVIVVYEACYSGSFLPLLVPGPAAGGAARLVLTSADADEKAWFDNNGMVSFSRYFWNSVEEGKTVAQCFTKGHDGMELPEYQHALIDADKDGEDTGGADMGVASLYKIGRGLVPAGVNPVVGAIMPEKRLYGDNHTAEIWAGDITPSSTVSYVWAVIKRPGVGAGIDSRAVVDLPEVHLIKGTGGQYKESYDNFTTPGVYTVAVYALDVSGAMSLPKVTTVIKDIDAYEEDDTPEQAKPIVVNASVWMSQYHNFWDTGDVDWVKFYGMQGEWYTINVFGQGSRCNAVVELYGPDNSSKFVKEIDIDNYESWRCMAEGLYHVRIYQFDGLSYGQYTNYFLRAFYSSLPVLGMIKGSITSGSGGGAISNAVITTDGGFSAISSSGAYEMPHEGGGPYALTAQATGYQTYTHSGINLESRQTLVLNIVMTPIGGTSTTTTVSGVTSTTTTASATTSTMSTTTTTVKQKCTVRKALGEGHEIELELVRKFRDTRLAPTAEGAQLVALYYRHSEELTMLLEKRSDIAAEVRDLVLELLPQVMTEPKLKLSNNMKQRLYGLIDQIRTEASPGLKKSLRLVRKKIEKNELGLK